MRQDSDGRRTLPPWCGPPAPRFAVGSTVYSDTCRGTVISLDTEHATISVVWSDGDGGSNNLPRQRNVFEDTVSMGNLKQRERTGRVDLRLHPDNKAKLERIATAKRRTITSIIDEIIEDMPEPEERK